MLETTEAIVLNTKKFGETSKIVSFFTKDFGKINAMVKGAQKPKSKFGSTLEPMNYLSIVFYKKPANQLQLLSDSEIAVNFWNIRTSLENTAIGFAIVETVYKILEEYYVNKSIFEDIVQSLEILNKQEASPFAVYLKFLFSFAVNLGLDINISNELFTTNNSNIRIFFNYVNGTFTTHNIRTEENRYYILIENNLFTKIDEIYNSDWDSLPKSVFSKSEMFQSIGLFNKFFVYHTERGLFLDSLSLIIS